MHYIYCFAILLLLVLNCNSEPDVKKIELKPPLTDVLTLELSFGDENTIVKDEFLLAQPRYITINDENDIFVVDENSVKVFNKNGKEKIILGRQGEGPGEFAFAGKPTISSTGFLTVMDLSGFNVFGPDLKFKVKVNTRNSPIIKKYLDERTLESGIFQVFSINETKRILKYNGFKIGDFERELNAIIYDNAETLTDLAYYDVDSWIFTGGKGASEISRVPTVGGGLKPFCGKFYGDMLPGNRVVFTHTEIDKSVDKENPYYVLHIKSFDTFEKTQISQPYTIIEIPYSAKKGYIERKTTSELSKIMKNIAENTKYYPPLRGLLTDRNYIFACTYQQNDEGEILVDVFDANTCEHVNSAYFPFIPKVIKNGYAYKFNDWRKNNEFPKVEKYKINPVIYGK